MGDDGYTPTTEAIREGYFDGEYEPYNPDYAGDLVYARFDRWLNEYTATVLESARNRLNGHDPAGEQLQKFADEMRAS